MKLVLCTLLVMCLILVEARPHHRDDHPSLTRGGAQNRGANCHGRHGGRGGGGETTTAAADTTTTAATTTAAAR